MTKSLVSVLIANIINLLLGLVNSFILPKYLSIETYASIKTFALYASYSGIFHLGYCDGMYLKYGGKKLEDIKEKLGNSFLGIVSLSLIWTVLLAIVAVLLKNYLLFSFALGLTASNVIDYYKLLYQAVGEFKAYGNALNLQKMVLLLLDLFLIFILMVNGDKPYIAARIIVPIIVAILLGISLNNKTSFITRGKFSLLEIKENISNGFVLMLGNFSTNLFTGIDRWFVSILMSATNFAMYAFAVSVENIINVFITPITVSMYNFCCRNRENNKYRSIKNLVLLWGFMVIAAAYPVKYILGSWLDTYDAANNVVFILFATQAFQVIIKGIYVNIYKANQQQNKYLKQMLAMLILAIVLNSLFYSVYDSIESIALATLITNIVWFIICEIDERSISFDIKEYIAIILLLGIFLYTGFFVEPVLGFVIYAFSGIGLALIFMRDSLFEIISIGSNYVNNFVKK